MFGHLTHAHGPHRASPRPAARSPAPPRPPRRPADEIDAIGKKRSDGPTDSGTQEREQGLMQMLTEMDGFYQDDKVGP